MEKGLLIRIASLAVCFLLSAGVGAQNRQYDSYKGLVMAGYQGWFNAPDDGAGRGWYHYKGNEGFRPGSCTIDFWPEVSEYEKLYKTEFKFDDGTPAYVFSSYDESTVDVHFKWMRDYGLDGVFMQRFVTEICRESSLKHFNKVLNSAMKAANKYNRAICVMYDLSGMRPGQESVLLKDISVIAEKYSLKDHNENPSYLYHNGKPLVTVWGVGFNDRRHYGLDEAEIAQQMIFPLIETEEELDINENAPITIAETEANIPVCTVSEAVMRMDLADECALMFRNKANNHISMVYRRKDGNIGWVEPKA